MMPRLFSFLILLCISLIATAQTRYLDEVFSQVTVTTDVQYGTAIDYLGNSVDLKADVFTPTGDTFSHRPAVILMHGGFFLAGTKEDVEMDVMCRAFAKRGYTAISIQYRLGANLLSPNLEETFSKSAIRAVQDLKGAVRFFRESVDMGNPYGMDGQVVFTGGYSAGAIAAIHAGYLTSQDNMEPWLDTAIQNLGGIEGSIGNMNYSSETNGILNLSGGIFDINFIQGTDPVMASVHGDQDGTVPYDSGTISLAGLNIIDLYGSYTMSLNYPFQISLLSLPGEDHYPLQNPTLQDTIVQFYANFMFAHFTPGSLQLEDENAIAVSVFPNPTSDWIKIQSEKPIRSIELRDLNGKLLQSIQDESGVDQIDLSLLKSGYYTLSFPETGQHKKILVQ